MQQGKRSLLDDKAFESIGQGKGGKKSGGASSSGDKIKMIAAGVLLVLAVGFLAYYYDLIPLKSKPKPVALTQEQQAAVTANEQQRAKMQSRPDVKQGSD